jgi:hypothetical protein
VKCSKLGFDAESRQYFARSFDDEGTTGVYEVELDRLTGLWELKSRRGVWQPWTKLELVKAR